MGKKRKRRQEAAAVETVPARSPERATLNELWARMSRLGEAADAAREGLFRSQADRLSPRMIGRAQGALYAAQEAYEQAHLDVWLALQEER